MAEIKDFLNPHSMLTPGVAAGLTVTTSMPVALAFGLSVKWLALVVSCLLGLLIILAIKDPMSPLQRSVYYLLNSLIIFSTALGAGISIDSPPRPPSPPNALLNPSLGSLQLPAVLGIGTAYAEESRVRAESHSPQIPPDKPNHAVSPRFPSAMAIVAERQIELKKMYEQQKKEYQQRLKAYERRWSW